MPANPIDLGAHSYPSAGGLVGAPGGPRHDCNGSPRPNPPSSKKL